MTSAPDYSADRLYCYRCGHYWKARSAGLPKTCPRCGSSRWNDPVRREATCRFCGHKWNMNALDEPCPGCCHTIFEAPDPSVRHCNRCDHEWHLRTDNEPARCPLCKSTKWNAPRPVRNTCRVCGNVWIGGGNRPQRCPSCKSTLWDRNPVRVQCKVCGHKWTVKGDRMSGSVRKCPSCHSAHWMEPPAIDRCGLCGLNYIRRSESSLLCPGCRGNPGFRAQRCGFCGMNWGSVDGAEVCPGCGRPVGPCDDSYMTVWSDGLHTLQYAYMDGQACIYLWEDGRPIAVSYFHDVCARLGMTQGGFIDALNEGSLNADMRDLVRDLYEHRFGYLKNVEYFVKRLGLSEEDAVILSIHFTGMCPEAIALYLNRPFKEIRLAFDRIMVAYEGSGILVDDDVFTDDPFRYYRRRPPFSGCLRDCADKLVNNGPDGRYIQSRCERAGRDYHCIRGRCDAALRDDPPVRCWCAGSVPPMRMPPLRRRFRTGRHRIRTRTDRIRLQVRVLRPHMEEPHRRAFQMPRMRDGRMEVQIRPLHLQTVQPRMGPAGERPRAVQMPQLQEHGLV